LSFHDVRKTRAQANRRWHLLGAAMTCHLNLPGRAGKRLGAIQRSSSGLKDRNLLPFPTQQRLEASMPEQGDGAAHCSNGLSPRNYREATPEEHATYRKWKLGMVVFYCTLLLISGVVAFVVDSGVGATRLTSLSAHPAAGSARSN
jgi:hypothetical protein